jgi:predicted Rossmann-fold nucleotide-binding protein
MAAACQGVTERGGTAVGVTISAWEDLVEVNRWLTHEVIARDLFARLPVISDAEAWVAFSGGVGTLQEVALCWNLVQTGLAEPRPLVLVGEAWDRQLRLFRELLRVSDPAHFDLVRPAATLEHVLDEIAPTVG